MSTALILIDIQNDYFPGGKMELSGSIQAASASARLIGVFRKQSWRIYHVQHVSTQPGATFFLPDTTGVEIHETVRPLPDENARSGFYAWLKRNPSRRTQEDERLKVAATVV